MQSLTIYSDESICLADADIGMIGLGVIKPGQLALLTGSSHLHLGVTDKMCGGALSSGWGWGTMSAAGGLAKQGRTGVQMCWLLL